LGSDKEKDGGKEKEGGKERWWTIGRGRKDSKDKEKTKRKGKENFKMSPSLKGMFFLCLIVALSSDLFNFPFSCGISTCD